MYSNHENYTYKAVYVSRNDVYVLMQDDTPVSTGKTVKEAFRNYFEFEAGYIGVDVRAFQDAVKAAVVDKLKVTAIKHLRDAFGVQKLGLREAKEMIEAIQDCVNQSQTQGEPTLGDILDAALKGR
jgi:hypothetical protein